ncbi:dipeptide ABC transporter ATP-binding protein [Roseovarius pelagicus]|uniref:ABC transporter ATP-binding protein n=1 Tax=Roseovarius pelagicus TaxID=2980108 RepID=A0ABY6D5W6_9RHOB|nr:ABC transporter ATP-binding protein [Roseovarius pelagicus]UXX81535.1 ABC transporter ATP-binding protein [Roseovarius pelagicus]
MNQIDKQDKTAADSLVRISGFGLGYQIGSQNLLQILRHIDLTIQKGDVVGLVGESGCGKSSLAYNLLGYRAGNSRIISGHVMLDDVDVTTLSRTELDKVRGRKVALVPQDPTTALSPHMRIASQLREVLIQHGYSSKSVDTAGRLRDLMMLIGLTDTDRILNSYPHELSGGQQQRIVIAMALSCDPEVVVLDEPTTGLDVTTQGQIIRLLRSLKVKLGTAMLYVTHDLNVLAQIADRVVVMYAGCVVETAPVDLLFEQPGHPYTRGLIGSIPSIRQTARNEMRLQGILRRSELGNGCPFAARCQYATDRCVHEMPEREQAAALHELACHHWRDLPKYAAYVSADAKTEIASVADRKDVLTVEDLDISYGSTGFFSRLLSRGTAPVVKGFSLTIKRGEIVSLVGESGSGKSTIAKAITGMIESVSGSIKYMGDQELGLIAARKNDLLREIQYVFQNPDSSLNPRRTIRATLTRPIRRFQPDLTANQRLELMVSALRNVQLDESYLSRYPGQLSGGERQRVAIARGLVANPSLLLCDEILSALDVSVQAKVIDVLLDLRKQGDIAMLFISHDLSVVRAISDRVVVLYKGAVMEQGKTDRIYEPPYHPYTHVLLSAAPEPGRALGEGEPVELPKLSGEGCVFANRCPWKKGEICDRETPAVRQTEDLTIHCHHDLETLGKLATWHKM